MSNVERRMHEYYFYPDGTPKRGPEAKRRNSTRLREEHYFVQALLDQYNEDHHLYEVRSNANPPRIHVLKNMH